MRAITVAAALLAALAVGCAEAATTASTSQLTVTYWSEGPGGAEPQRWTLRCGPAAGSHPSANRACTKLAAIRRPFAPIAKDAVCTQIYGGPETALVTGTYRGRRVWARFGRKDGCQISRWNKHVPVLPSGGG